MAGEGEPRERIVVEVSGRRLEVVVPAGFGARPTGKPSLAGPGRPAGRPRRGHGKAGAAVSGDALVSPMQGTIVKIVAKEGQRVTTGDTIVVLEAMKMEQPLNAHKDGTVAGLTLQVGETVPAGDVICRLEG
jgi:acetyl-CoA/propionyl-CoA carboxylase biotin carboxyl carrier protein